MIKQHSKLRLCKEPNFGVPAGKKTIAELGGVPKKEILLQWVCVCVFVQIRNPENGLSLDWVIYISGVLLEWMGLHGEMISSPKGSLGCRISMDKAGRLKGNHPGKHPPPQCLTLSAKKTNHDPHKRAPVLGA